MYLLVRFRFRLGTEANRLAALSAPPASSAAGGNVGPGRQQMDTGWAGIRATSMDDLVGLHGAAALFEAEFTLSEMAAERVVHAPTAMLSGTGRARQLMGTTPVRHGVEIRSAILHYNYFLGGTDHMDALRVLGQRVQAEDVIR